MYLLTIDKTIFSVKVGTNSQGSTYIAMYMAMKSDIIDGKYYYYSLNHPNEKKKKEDFGDDFLKYINAANPIHLWFFMYESETYINDHKTTPYDTYSVCNSVLI